MKNMVLQTGYISGNLISRLLKIDTYENFIIILMVKACQMV